MHHDNHEEHEKPPNFWCSRYAIGLIVIGAVAAYFLLTEHLAHVLGALPFLLLLACPLMHIFMHHDHGAHGDRGGHGGCHHGNDEAKTETQKSAQAKTGEPL